jgi:hypothetical protein
VQPRRDPAGTDKQREQPQHCTNAPIAKCNRHRDRAAEQGVVRRKAVIRVVRNERREMAGHERTRIEVERRDEPAEEQRQHSGDKPDDGHLFLHRTWQAKKPDCSDGRKEQELIVRRDDDERIEHVRMDRRDAAESALELQARTAASAAASEPAVQLRHPAMIFRAPEEPLEIPEVALTPFLMENAEGRDDKPALIDVPTGRTLTYRGWAESVRKAAAGLSQQPMDARQTVHFQR